VYFEIETEGSRYSRLSQMSGHTRLLYDMYLAHVSKEGADYERFIALVGRDGLKLFDALHFRTSETSSTEVAVRVGGKIERRRKHKLIVILQFRIGKQRLSPNQLSEGTFKTIALLFRVITAASTAILIEEPEVCIHQGLLSSILELVKIYAQDKLIVISTHSDYVLDHVDPENVHHVTFDRSKGTLVRHIKNTMTTKEYAALRRYLREQGNLGEYWREGGLGNPR